MDLRLSCLHLGTLVTKPRLAHSRSSELSHGIPENDKPWAPLTPELGSERHSCARPLADNAVIRKGKNKQTKNCFPTFSGTIKAEKKNVCISKDIFET